MSQYGGPDGEMGASMRYLSQRFTSQRHQDLCGSGYKLPDEVENQIEAYIDNDCAGIQLMTGDDVGRVYRRDDGLQDYVDHLYESIHGDLSGLNICIDCANGASAWWHRSCSPGWAPKCTFLGISPDGENINKGVGSTHLDNLEKAVVAGGFDCASPLTAMPTAALPATRRAARWTATRSLPCWP